LGLNYTETSEVICWSLVLAGMECDVNQALQLRSVTVYEAYNSILVATRPLNLPLATRNYRLRHMSLGVGNYHSKFPPKSFKILGE